MSKIHTVSNEYIVGEPFPVDPNLQTVKAMRIEPDRYEPEHIRQIIANATASGASDITIRTDQPPRVEIHGRLYRVDSRPLTMSEVEQFLALVYRSPNAAAEIKGRKVLDFAWEIRLDRQTRQRYRVNATGVLAANDDGVEISLRALPQRTPGLADVGLDPALMEPMSPNNGIVVVAGATGHGKSTTLAAVTRHHLEDTEHPRKIIDFQKPIEYTFYDVVYQIEGAASIIGQSEIGRHITDFATGVWSALRRRPSIIIVGESRDLETINASIEASLTGHLVYTTTHAGSVNETIRRIVQTFPGEEREGKAFDLISSLRFCITQYLLPRADRTGRVAIREYLHIDEDVRMAFTRRHPDDWPKLVDELMNSSSSGVLKFPMWRAAQDMLDAGIIDEKTARPFLVRKSHRYDDQNPFVSADGAMI